MIRRPPPPRLASAIVARFLPSDEAEFLLGDLAEQYVARASVSVTRAYIWYWDQAVRSSVTFLSQPRADSRPRHMKLQPLWQTVIYDVRYAVRSLRKSPGFSMIAVLTLAIGIGANTAIFSVVNAVVLRRLPFEHPQELMRLYLLMPPSSPGEAPLDMFWSFPKYEVLRETQDVFSELATFRRYDFTLTGVDVPERVSGEVVGASYLELLGVRPLMGRSFLPEEGMSAAPGDVAILSYNLWRRLYNGEADALGNTMRLNAVTYTIVGVTPAGFRGLSGAAQLFLPTTVLPAGDLNNAFAHNQHVVARLKPGATVLQAKQTLPIIGQRIDETFPVTGATSRWGAHARSLEEVRVEPVIRTSLLLLLGAVGFVLLIACVNLAGLLLGRAATRQREVAIRLSVGASRGRLVRQLLTESTVLAALGGAAGLALALPSVGFLRRIAPQATGVFSEDISGLTQMGMAAIRVDAIALAFTLGVTVLTGILFGLVPALQTSRPDLTNALKEGGGGRNASTSMPVATREALVTAELALAFVLLVGSGLMIKSLGQLQNTETGFDPKNVLTMGLGLPSAEYDRTAGHQFVESFHERVRALPEVTSVAYNLCTPLSSGCNGTGMQFRDRPPSDPGSRAGVEIHFATPEYFETLRIPVIRGRAFTSQDRGGGRGVAIVSEMAARQFWPDDDPIGKIVTLGQGDNGDREIVGVVGNVRYDAVDADAFPAAYIPLLQSSRRSGFTLVRTSGDPTRLIPTIREIVREFDANLPLYDVKTLEQRLGEATSNARFGALLLSAYAAIALILAAIGIYGVLSYAVAQRTHEIGLRMALGAERSSIVKLVVGRALTMALIGLGAGLITAWGLTRVLAAILYEVRPNDPVTFGLVAFVLAALAFVASYVPARRASRVDPLIALKRE